jgi:hypothetical protein
MKLTDFDKKEYANQALRENYKIDLDVRKMTMPATRTMLKKVRSLAMEAKQSNDSYDYQSNPSYMKLVFMEQALVTHYNQLTTSRPRIVIENEEVEKSQVVLAAQDMVDSVRKMIEEVSDMLVKELPALTDSIQSEIGVNESEQFNQQATEALTTIQSALTQGQGTLKGALGTITGQGGAGFGADMGADMGDEMGADLDMEEPLPGGGEETVDLDLEEPDLSAEPEAEPLGGPGRAKR